MLDADIETKPRKKADRMLRSNAARKRRRFLKNIRETRLNNFYAKMRRSRKRS